VIDEFRPLAPDLASAMRRARRPPMASNEKANWSNWYAGYMVAEQAGNCHHHRRRRLAGRSALARPMAA
jgi:hypothetical protein